MLKKKYRLKENEVKKVFKVWKPFFSYWIVLNLHENKFPYNRYAVIISAKNVDNNVTRNFFRRKFYEIVEKFEKKVNLDKNLENTFSENSRFYDYVFLIKKWVKLEKNSSESILNFEKNINYLLNKI